MRRIPNLVYIVLLSASQLVGCNLGLRMIDEPKPAEEVPAEAVSEELEQANDSDSDTESAEDAPSEPEEALVPQFVLGCGDEVDADTSASYGNARLDSYACSGWDASGPEVVFEIQDGLDGLLTARLTDLSDDADLDVYVLTKDGHDPSGDTCISYGDAETVWEASAGMDYFVVVDGHHGDVGSFTLEIDCQPIERALNLEERAYCLDWDTTTITEPVQLPSMLAEIGVDMADHAMLLSPTFIDVEAQAIDMTVAFAEIGTCVQNLDLPTTDMSGPLGGHYAAGHFEIGPADLDLPVMDATIPILEVEVSGNFTFDGSQIVDTTIDGEINVTGLPPALCDEFDCHVCPFGVGTCVSFSVHSGVLTDNGLGPVETVR